MLRLFPKEQTVKMKMTPAFEESLMRMEEENNEEAGKWINYLFILLLKDVLYRNEE